MLIDDSDRYLQLALALRDQARQQYQRRTLVLSGEVEWCRQLAQLIWRQLAEEKCYWIGESSTTNESINYRRSKKLLGTECSLLVYDAHSGFEPDSFGAATGTICGGGILLLLMPPLSEWHSYDDPNYEYLLVANHLRSEIKGRFVQHFVKQLSKAKGVLLCAQGEELPILVPVNVTIPQVDAPSPYVTNDQQLATQAIHHVMSGHRRRPLVITSDRGRGKSSALGLAAAQLMKQGVSRVLITAPSREAVNSLFTHAAALLGINDIVDNALHWQGAVLQFVAPDQLLASKEGVDLLLVDEAAAIPVAILQALLVRYSRIVFASTIYGYEGSGRGFAIRFQKYLDDVTPNWKRLYMKQPIRWADNDPLESFLFHSLCLDAEPAPLKIATTLIPEQCVIRLVDRDELLVDSALLNSIFGLLVSAHYRTSPSDLQNLLDGPNLSIYVMQTPKIMGEQVVGVLLLADEGCFDNDMAMQIQQGRRRPRGHLLSQTLAFQLGLANGAELRSGRVMRIAIHPNLQRQGFGRQLLSAVKNACYEQKLDLLGASFGATTDLLQFWQQQNMAPVLLGMGRESSSGAHATLMLQPLSQAGCDLFKQARVRGRQFLLSQLSEPLADLEADVALLLLQQQLNLPVPVLDEMDELDLYNFAHHQRGYEFSLHAIQPLALWGLINHQSRLSESQSVLLLCRVLQRRSVSDCVQLIGCTGRKQLIVALRESVQVLLYLWLKN